MSLRTLFCQCLLVAATLASAPSSALVAADTGRLEDARRLFEQRKDAEAQAAFTALAAEDPRLPDAPFHLGMLALRRQAWDEGKDFLEQAAALNPDSAEYQLQLGTAHGLLAMHGGLFGKLGHAKKCRQAYERAVALDPQHLGARWCLMEYYKLAPGMVGGSIPRAQAQADAIAQIDPVAGRFARAGVLAADKKHDEAFALYDGVLAAEPPDYAALNQLGHLALQTKRRLGDGIAALQKCLTLPEPAGQPKHSVLHLALGKLHELQGDASAARTAYAHALALDPHFEPAAAALKKLGDG